MTEYSIYKRLWHLLLLSQICLICLLGLSQAYGQTLSAQTDLKETASEQAKTVKTLPANTSLKLLKRQGFWTEVEAQGAKGWVKLSQVQLSASGGLAAGLDTGRTSKGNIVSTSAARGLSSKELTQAKPDFKSFDQWRGWAVSSQAADAFAQKGGLRGTSVAMLAPAASEGKPSAAEAQSRRPSKKKSKSEDDDDDD